MPSDTERLNWLASNGDKIVGYTTDDQVMPDIWYIKKVRDDINGVNHIGPYTNFRYVIDAAMLP